MRAVTFGPFPIEKSLDPYQEFPKIRAAGFNTLRLFTLPEQSLLAAAHENDLQIFAGLDWWQFGDFFASSKHLSHARVRLTSWLTENANHPALSGVYIGNEIPADLVRYLGPVRVRQALEDLIDHGRTAAPHLLFAYANYPSTEYLEPANADFTAFNIYLEAPIPFTKYLRRLQNIAGDRPLVISEFGLDSLRNTPETQAETLKWATEIAHQEATSGITIFSYSDLWQNGGREVTDWNFGLSDRLGNPKPALHTLQNLTLPPTPPLSHTFSIIVCTRNGATRIESCLRALENLQHGPFEIIVVDDGSTDHTAALVSEKFPSVILKTIPPSGLSAARNTGAAIASGEILAFTDDDCQPDTEWITHLDSAFKNPSTAAAGGPNLPPPPRTPKDAIICSAPGSPSHILLDDTQAEHIPGCNLAVRASVFHSIKGFNPIFKTAGDDVDFCWRLSDANHLITFVPSAFVWHSRRPSIRAFLRQQRGYGLAERILLETHPHRFTQRGEARWAGVVYCGSPVRVTRDSFIYHGPMGLAPYQSLSTHSLAVRPLPSRFSTISTRFQLSALQILQPIVRSLYRNHRLPPRRSKESRKHSPSPPSSQLSIHSPHGKDRLHYLKYLKSQNWLPGTPSSDFDLTKQSTRIIIATESLPQNGTNILIKIWGDQQLVLLDLPPPPLLE